MKNVKNSEVIHVFANNSDLRKRMGGYGMEREKTFLKESFTMNFVDVIKNVVHLESESRNFVYWYWETSIAPDSFEVAA